MRAKTCCDCGVELRGHSRTVKRCKPCGGRRRADRTKRATYKCSQCGLRFRDYKCNRKSAKVYCSAACRVAGVGSTISLALGGDGKPAKTKKEKDAKSYARHAASKRDKVLAHYRKNRRKILDKIKAKNRALKVEVIGAYGGICACCGECHIEFLTIDHVNGDGHEHRRQVGKGRRIYADIKKQGFPQNGRFRVLCLNCNIALGFYGYCPHRPNVHRVVDKSPKGEKAGRPRTVK